MSRQALRDRNNRLLGYVAILYDGRHELRDRDNRLLGHYNPDRDETRDRNNRLIGHGDLLMMLLEEV